VSEKERVVNLGELLGKLPAGVGSLTGLKDDRRNKVTPGMCTPDIMKVIQLLVRCHSVKVTTVLMITINIFAACDLSLHYTHRLFSCV